MKSKAMNPKLFGDSYGVSYKGDFKAGIFIVFPLATTGDFFTTFLVFGDFLGEVGDFYFGDFFYEIGDYSGSSTFFYFGTL